MRNGLFLMLLGILVLVMGIFGNLAFMDIILWIIAVFFAVLGIEGMMRYGFPTGLVSLSIALLIILHVMNVLNLSFWRLAFAVFGIWLIQIGLFRMRGRYNPWMRFNTRRRRF